MTFGSYGTGPWSVVYPDQVNRFETEVEAREWAENRGGRGRVVFDGRQNSGDLFEMGAVIDRADQRK